MKIAIIGLANSGKTTVFNALTRGTAETTAYASGQLEPNLATVKVPDSRLDVLARMFRRFFFRKSLRVSGTLFTNQTGPAPVKRSRLFSHCAPPCWNML